MQRYFEFQDSKSYKFWQIEVEQTTCTVKYGKIGTAGQEKVSHFDSEEKAQKEMAKLIAEKTKKGYVEKGEASEKKASKRIAVSYDEAEAGKTLLEKVTAFVEGPQVSEVTSLVLGAWEESYENSVQSVLDYLAAHGAQLANLKELFVGDMDSEECEISWIIQGDYTQLLKALPNLERLHIKGSTSMTLSAEPLRHEHLKALTIECGGLPQAIIATIAQAHLPNLEHLCLYLGVEDYGFDGGVDDLRPFLEKGRFPKLTYLGLTDSELADDIARMVADAPVLEQLETLDLSLGTLTDAGAEALLTSSKINQLKRLDLHYHYLSNEMIKKIKALPIIVDVSDQQEAETDDDDVWRYPAVTE